MNVLGIETSCDETSAALVEDGKKVLSNTVASSLDFHKKYGGIIPEIASRMQLETITEIVDSAIKEAKIKVKDIGLISVTNGPGLLGSLLVGISFAKSLSLSLNKPLLGVNHIHSHFYANFLNGGKISFPFMALVVSGGHTSLFRVRDFDKIKILGQTQDDACGEAFDKVAKILGLGYPGGPAIEKMARQGLPKRIKLNCSGTKNEFDFSFSGIKTAVMYYARGKRLSVQEKRDISASFQESVIDCLVRKAISACKIERINRLLLGGGVVANNRLREKFGQAAQGSGLKCYFPEKPLCMDNAAMIAGLGYQLFKKGYCSSIALTADLS